MQCHQSAIQPVRAPPAVHYLPSITPTEKESPEPDEVSNGFASIAEVSQCEPPVRRVATCSSARDCCDSRLPLLQHLLKGVRSERVEHCVAVLRDCREPKPDGDLRRTSSGGRTLSPTPSQTESPARCGRDPPCHPPGHGSTRASASARRPPALRMPSRRATPRRAGEGIPEPNRTPKRVPSPG